eukprot:9025107-Pyramimonas_sp.AAC.1
MSAVHVQGETHIQPTTSGNTTSPLSLSQARLAQAAQRINMSFSQRSFAEQRYPRSQNSYPTRIAASRSPWGC